MSVALYVQRLTVTLGKDAVLEDLDLTLDAGGYGVVLGRSGAGKSTLLRAIAGLTAAEGTIRIGNQTVCGPTQVTPPERRRVGFLFQGLALWPHMTVEQHLRYALDGAKVPRAEQRARVRTLLDELGIGRHIDRRPGELSGGERQRLALARALAPRPELLLLDEPTASVDPVRAREIRDLLAETRRRFGTTVLHVTHDQEEAMELGDRLFFLEGGAIVQAGPPAELHDQPATMEVARFLGRGALLPATAHSGDAADCALGSVRLVRPTEPGPIVLLVRPEDLEPVAEGRGIPSVVHRAGYRFGRYRTEVAIGEHRLWVDLPQRPTIDEPIWLAVRGPLASLGRRDVVG